MSAPRKAIISFQEEKRKALEQFEDQLEPLDLTKIKIEQQNLSELESSLDRVNDAIKNPESFGVLRLKMVADLGLIVAKSQSEAQFEIGIMPLLLERKKLILERIRELKAMQNVESLRDIAEEIPEDEVRVKIESRIEELKRQSEDFIKEAQEVEQARQKEERLSQEQLARLEMEMKERRARIWQTFLEKESVATMIGSLLLIILTVCLVIAMFTKIQSTDILNNAFLLILGYFFGQTVSRRELKSEGKLSDDDG
jgi:uncharacterized membrane protein